MLSVAIGLLSIRAAQFPRKHRQCTISPRSMCTGSRDGATRFACSLPTYLSEILWLSPTPSPPSSCFECSAETPDAVHRRPRATTRSHRPILARLQTTPV